MQAELQIANWSKVNTAYKSVGLALTKLPHDREPTATGRMAAKQ